MTRRTTRRNRLRVDRRGQVVDERGRRAPASAFADPADCCICERPMSTGVRTRRGYAHRGCAEGVER